MKHGRDDYDRIQDPTGLIPEDEPVFLLRAQDKHAAMAVRNYAMRVRVAGGDPGIIDIAEAHADLMDAWLKHKSPDLP